MRRRAMVLIATTLFLITVPPRIRAEEVPPGEQTVIMNTIPGNTAFTDRDSRSERVSDASGNPLGGFERIVTTIMSFGIGSDGKPKTTIPDLETEAATLRGLFDKELYHGGKLMPKMLQDRLQKPQRHENSDLVEQYAAKTCVTVQTQKTKKKINEEVAVTERFPDKIYDAFWGLYTIAAIQGTSKPLPSVDFYTPPQEIFRMDEQTGRRILKEEFYTKDPDDDIEDESSSLLYDCDAESEKTSVRDELITIFGSVGSQRQGLKAKASAADIIQFLTGILGCALRAVECYERAMAIDITHTTTVVLPGAPKMYALATGEFRRGYAFPGAAPADKVEDLRTDRGVFNTFYALKYLDENLRIPYDDSHAGTRRTAVTEVKASPPEDAQGGKQIPHAGLAAVKKRFQHAVGCAIMPLALQDNCENLPTDTSSWAQAGAFTGTPLDPSTAPLEGEFSALLRSTAQEIGLPACVLDGVAMIEGGPNMGEIADINSCFAKVNSCSATGPMQFTTGRDANGDTSCSSCQSSWVQEHGCPNAWDTWGSGGNPCLYSDSLRAAARKLKNDGGLTFDHPQNQREGIEEAGYRYYGSRKPVGRLGNLSYGQFLYAHCQAHSTYGTLNL